MVNQGMIFSIVQLRLCLNVLHSGRWNDLPLLESPVPVEQRLMNAMLELISQGRFVPEGDVYRMEENLETMLWKVLTCERVRTIRSGDQIVLLSYETGAEAVTLTPDMGHPGYCVIALEAPPQPGQGCQEICLPAEEHRQKSIPLTELRLFYSGMNEEEKR